MRKLSVAIWAALLMALIFLPACSSGKSSTPVEKPGARAGVPVTVGMVTRKTVPVQARAIGNVQSYSTIAVRAQVGGEVTGVHFKEGQEVRKGDLLFAIDARPFEAALRQAEANLGRDRAMAQQAEANIARDLAHAKNAQVEAQRYATLIEEGIVAKEQYDQMRTNWEALDASVRAGRAALENAQAAIRADQAAVENAKIQLGYCTIRSQIDGRTGNLMVHPGNIVRTNEPTPLVVINQITPIYVSFAVPEQILPEIKKHMAAGKLVVEAFLTKDEKQSTRGQLTFVDNTVDAATGTIQLKATFANQDKALWPGQFVNVVLTLSAQPDAIVAPSRAIQAGQQGQYAFVVKPDLTVEVRKVVMGRTVDSEVVIEKGLEPGDKVVTDGQLRLMAGTKVDIKPALTAPTPEESAR